MFLDLNFLSFLLGIIGVPTASCSQFSGMILVFRFYQSLIFSVILTSINGKQNTKFNFFNHLVYSFPIPVVITYHKLSGFT